MQAHYPNGRAENYVVKTDGGSKKAREVVEAAEPHADRVEVETAAPERVDAAYPDLQEDYPLWMSNTSG